MVISNVFLLTETDPWEVYKWFMSLVTIDAYEWVMFPNIFGMGIHSVGTLMMTRPYFSSSNYILKMSHYSKKDGNIKIDNEEYSWADIWDALYYRFINKHKKLLAKNYATANAVKNWNKKSKEEQNELLEIAEEYLDKY